VQIVGTMGGASLMLRMSRLRRLEPRGEGHRDRPPTHPHRRSGGKLPNRCSCRWSGPGEPRAVRTPTQARNGSARGALVMSSIRCSARTVHMARSAGLLVTCCDATRHTSSPAGRYRPVMCLTLSSREESMAWNESWNHSVFDCVHSGHSEHPSERSVPGSAFSAAGKCSHNPSVLGSIPSRPT
jgi:hypothetical protein